MNTTYIIYSDERVIYNKPFNYDMFDATSKYIEHYHNYMYLKFMSDHADTTFDEKQRARHELVICERKMQYAQRHPNYNRDVANDAVTKILREWKNG